MYKYMKFIVLLRVMFIKLMLKACCRELQYLDIEPHPIHSFSGVNGLQLSQPILHNEPEVNILKFWSI